MRRIHLFEFEDFAWFPDAIRKGITDYLQFLANTGNLYKSVIPIIKRGIEKSSAKKIVDLCSGGGGGMKRISEYLKKENVQAKITLTDKYPNILAFEKIEKESKGYIDCMKDSIDASAVPAELHGFRTMFASFHHFKPADAQRILQDAANNKEPIGVFEYTERTFVNFLFCLLAPFIILIVTPFIGRITLEKLFFTYIIPAIPLITMWDGIVSLLRTYGIPELQQMTKKVSAPNYMWEIKRVNVGPALFVLYLFGYPQSNQ